MQLRIRPYSWLYWVFPELRVLFFLYIYVSECTETQSQGFEIIEQAVNLRPVDYKMVTQLVLHNLTL